MAPATLLFLARHGQTGFNKEGRIQGQTDVPLDELGLRQAEALAGFACGAGVHAVYASDLRRAHHTARVCAERCGLSLHLRRDLRERDFGLLEGQTRAEMGPTLSGLLQVSRENEAVPLPGGGESYRQLRERATGALLAMAADHPSQRVLVVSHGAFLKCVLEWALGLVPGDAGRFVLANAGVSRLQLRDGLPLLLSLNDTCHLGDWQVPG